MKIEIWSDVACPFCYIGKRKIENAIAKFPHKDKIEVEWKSFMLNPDQVTQPNKSSEEYLSEVKGWSLEQTREITANVTNMASELGLDYHLDKSVVANTKKAHRVLHLAKTVGKGDEMKESLLKAYFTDGLNIDDDAVLLGLGKEICLSENTIQEVISSNKFENEVDQDIYESRTIGVKGVPFFVLDRKFGISGAQPDEVFDQTLEKAWNEFSKSNSGLEISSGTGESCDVNDKNC
ncbi:putative DsbA family dithiol-disulfide isomerase [Algoriphagus ratkowskyi]|uniref:DsbA family oxidoreductase n=1 Tax=Algoriphagus ratkowskyi TaxID=57028 RepID=A0A2W7REU1_9BACT|nr:DsbA family oxidoreductase [Algoriphagus ratkowskyi]PZX56900.1 putative DsbA family dithiol-disulfide isomerase [Algoriphagus ratkowskyi]TXD79814.1 DsbA family oxidoreductase [Algoriphagus ratkowskyi]